MIKVKKHRRLMAEINVVPYIDVMLVLLVIFMITAPLITQGVYVDVPQSNAVNISEGDGNPVIITVNKLGEFFLNRGEHQELPVDDNALVIGITTVLSKQTDAVVMVRGDSQVDYGRVVHAMVLAQAAGASSVGLITEAPKND